MASHTDMQKLTETWKQKKPVARLGCNVAVKDGSNKPSGGTKRLGVGRIAAASSNRSGSTVTSLATYRPPAAGGNTEIKQSWPDVSFTTSFGPDFDDELISAVNSLEQDITESCQSSSGAKQSSGVDMKEHWKTSLQTPVKQPQLCTNGDKPGKRKKSSTRKSGAVKPSLFGETSGASFLSDSLTHTPTHSPADKKRRENTPTPAAKRGIAKTDRTMSLSSFSAKELSLTATSGGEQLPSVTVHRRPETKFTSVSELGTSGHKKNCCDTDDSNDALARGQCYEEDVTIETDTSPAMSCVSAAIGQTHKPPTVTLAGIQPQAKKIGSVANEDKTCSTLKRKDHSKDSSTCGSGVRTYISPLTTSAPTSLSTGGCCSAQYANTKPSSHFTGLRTSTRNIAQRSTVDDTANAMRDTGHGNIAADSTAGRRHTQTRHSQSDHHETHGNTNRKESDAERHAGSDNMIISSQNNAANTSRSQTMDNPRSLLLSEWGLPPPVLEAYHSQGITTMFPWQAHCLTTGNVLDGGNLVYSAPTSAGKTMVAELLVLKRVLETRHKALFILPFVSVTREKMISLQRLYQDAGVRVGGFMGSHSPAGGFQSLDVAVCTIEKGNGLVNRLLEENRIDELCVVVIDELHMVGDSNRGYLLELLLTKVCYMSRRSKEDGSTCPVQLIGMSATLPNLDLLARWLDANLYHTDFRPVPLTENIKVGSTIYDGFMNKVREIEVKTTVKGDEDQIIPLCVETVIGGHSVLIFCPTKVWCEKMAEKVAREFYEMLRNPTALAAYLGDTGFVKASEMARLPIDQPSLMNVLEQLGRSPVGVDPMLGKLIQYGVAYHHAGLTFDERDIVEGAFRQGYLKVLVATSTLSSGVNLPARRVIVRSPMFGGRVMDILAYKQMAGRAGRKGVDTEGECILVCKETEKRAAQTLLQAALPPVSSCLSCGGEGAELSRSMKRAILEVVVSGVASTPEDVACYAACTLLSASLPRDSHETDTLISACLRFLEDNEFVRLQAVKAESGSGEVQKYQPTQLGSAVLASSMSPDEGLAVFAELQKARQCFVLSCELHIIYLVTPIYSQDISASLDWYHYYCLWEKLSPDMRLVAKVVGVEEGFLAKAVAGRLPTKTATQARAVAIHRRFYTALALHDLVQEVPLMEVARRYNCNKGQLQSLMQSAATFAGMVTVFCARLGWSSMELLISQFQQRLTLGVTRELCDLVRIPLLTGTMARVLFNAGYQTVASVAHAQATDLENVFRKASPFQSNKKQEGESEWDLEQRRKARCVYLAGRQGVTELEAATAIISEAKSIIQQELGVHIDWHAENAKPRTNDGDGSLSALESGEDMSVCRTPRAVGAVARGKDSHELLPLAGAHEHPGLLQKSDRNVSGTQAHQESDLAQKPDGIVNCLESGRDSCLIQKTGSEVSGTGLLENPNLLHQSGSNISKEEVHGDPHLTKSVGSNVSRISPGNRRISPRNSAQGKYSPELSTAGQTSSYISPPYQSSANRSRKSLSRRSLQKRNSGGGVAPYMKSPPYGRRMSGEGSVSGSNRSPKEVSFFGQVVVSPPPPLAAHKSGVTAQSAAHSSSSRNVEQTSIKVTKHLSGGLNAPNGGLNPTAAVSSTTSAVSWKPSTSSVVDVETCSAEYAGGSNTNNAASKNMESEKSPQLSSGGHILSTPKTTLPRARSRDLTKAPIGGGFISALKHAADCVNYNSGAETVVSAVTSATGMYNSNAADMAGAAFSEKAVSRKAVNSAVITTAVNDGKTADSFVLKDALSVADIAIPAVSTAENTSFSKQTNEPRQNDADVSLSCFEDSLILDTQTANLLSSENCLSVQKECTTLPSLTTSTPFHTAGKSYESVRNSAHSVAQLHLNHEFTGALHAEETSPNLYLEPEVIVRNPAGNHHSLHKPQAEMRITSRLPTHLKENFPENPDNLDDDLFHSPLLSISAEKNPACLKQRQRIKSPVLVDPVSEKTTFGNRNKEFNSAETVPENVGAEEDTSCELIAASNYERLAYVEEGVVADDSANMSYQDLCITQTGDVGVSGSDFTNKATSGHLFCEDRDPEERHLGQAAEMREEAVVSNHQYVGQTRFRKETLLREQGHLGKTEARRENQLNDQQHSGEKVTGRQSVFCEQHYTGQTKTREQAVLNSTDTRTSPVSSNLENDQLTEYDIREDLAIAMNMSESFTSVGEYPAAKSSLRNKPVTPELPSFSDSFTASVLEKAMADDMFSDTNEEIADSPEAIVGTKTGKSVQKRNPTEKTNKNEKKTPALFPKCQQNFGIKGCNSNERKADRDSTGSVSNCGSTTPQTEGDLVPPTPPDENSVSVNTPHVRRTPLRACRNKTENSVQKKSQKPKDVQEQKRKPRNKENVADKQTQKEIAAAENQKEKKQTAERGKMKQIADRKQQQQENAIEKQKQTPAKGKGKADVQLVASESDSCHLTRSTLRNLKADPRKDLFQDMDSTHTISACSKNDFSPDPEGKSENSHEENMPCAPHTTVSTEVNCSNAIAESCSPPPTQESFTIIDVCADARLFQTFVEEWKRQSAYAVSLACEKKPTLQQTGGGIGGNFMKNKPTESAAVQHDIPGIEIPGDDERLIVGLAVSWENRDAYYISLCANTDAANTSLDATMAAPPCDECVTHTHKTQAIRAILRKTVDKNPTTLIAYDLKSVYCVMVRGLGIEFGQCRDPQIANWLQDPGAKEKTVHAMVTNYLPEDLPLLEGIGGGVGYSSLGLTVRNHGSGRMRAAAESIISRRLMDHFWTQLVSTGLDEAFLTVEMPSVITMARMELNGFGFSEEECESQKSLMMTKLSALEQEAYHLAGHPFSLTCTDDVAQVLYLELQLPVNGDPTATKPARTLGPSRRGRGRQKSVFSTSKDILEKLKSYHPLPGIILEWRRISSALTKHVYPLQKEKVFSERLGMYRIFGECQLHTATGRVSMCEPNLQNIPKDFEITLPDVIGESPPAPVACSTTDRHGRRAGNSRLQSMRGVIPQSAQVTDPSAAKHMAVSMRHAFIPFKGGVIVAADYSQLELRVIAHLSDDKKLTSILNDDGDVFKMIAAQWKNTVPEEVTAEQRQQAKQVCYGMLYGIGAKALGEQLGVEENDAAVFIETFKARYKGMRSYLRQTVEKCREQGYVTTIAGRRRYLPAIKDTNPHARAQAERQAVNTTVQGSAADIVKAAMNKIDHHFAKVFPDTRLPHRHLEADAGQPQGAFLVLQLHDELIYEVSQADVSQAAHIIKQCMENTTQLSVRLPVKVKAGPSWGRLQEM